MRSLKELNAWLAAEQDPAVKQKKRFFVQAATAMGQNGSTEEQLLRLMIWVGCKLRFAPTHSGIETPMEILLDGTAWCDQYTKVFMLMSWNLLGADVHELAIYHTDKSNGHTVCEAEYTGGWHLFDVHVDHQAVYRHPADGHILSYDEIVTMPQVVAAERHWWTGNDKRGKEGFYIIQEGARVRRDFPSASFWMRMQSEWQEFLRG